MKKLNSDASLEWTGERLVTSCSRPLVYEHLHRYALACGLTKGKRVLDIACGEGYGADLLARDAAHVIAVDLDAGTIAHARAKYRRRNLRFLRGSCTEIPCSDDSIDLIASFETIEHISEHDRFLSEIKRVLRPGGILVISSPNKTEYQKASNEANPFHQVELTHAEFVQLIRKTFKHNVVGRQRLVVGSWIAPDALSTKVAVATFRGGFEGIQLENGVYRGTYSIAVCSDKPLPVFSLGMFENYRESADTWNLLEPYDTPAQIAARLLEVAEVSELQRVLQEARDAFDEKSVHVVQLQGELEERRNMVEERSKHVALLQRDLEERSNQVWHFRDVAEEQSKHVTFLERNLADLRATLDDRLTRAKSELLDARWEAVMLREAALRHRGTAEETSSRIVELEDRAETAVSERDQLRSMITALQKDLEQEQAASHAKEAQLKVRALRSQQKQMDRLRASLSRKLILPFGKSQRKLQQLTAVRQVDD